MAIDFTSNEQPLIIDSYLLFTTRCRVSVDFGLIDSVATMKSMCVSIVVIFFLAAGCTFANDGCFSQFSKPPIDTGDDCTESDFSIKFASNMRFCSTSGKPCPFADLTFFKNFPTTSPSVDFRGADQVRLTLVAGCYV